MTSSTACPTCDAERWVPVLRVGAVPVAVGNVLPSRSAALDAARGDLELACCTNCGLVRNLAFDPRALLYTREYDSSQFCSPTFAAYARDLVATLVADHRLVGDTVVDIGCGKGELLELFLAAGVGHGIGVDPAYGGERSALERSGHLRIIRDAYRGQLGAADAALWCCRHVLEHLSDPAELLRQMRQDVGRGVIYLEVPDAEHLLSDAGLWDVVYPHVSYFTAPALRALVERCGWQVLGITSEFGGQFLGLHAGPAASRTTLTAGEDVRAVTQRAMALSGRFERAVGEWDSLMSRRRGRGTTVLWGAGAKSVTFLNATSAGEVVDVVVDINPSKHGSYIPGTGQQIVGPDALPALHPATVVVMNHNYEPEIRAELDAHGLHPEVLCA